MQVTFYLLTSHLTYSTYDFRCGKQVFWFKCCRDSEIDWLFSMGRSDPPDACYKRFHHLVALFPCIFDHLEDTNTLTKCTFNLSSGIKSTLIYVALSDSKSLIILYKKYIFFPVFFFQVRQTSAVLWWYDHNN